MSRAEASLASGSGFDEELGRFLTAVYGGSFVELLRQKCAIGTAKSEPFTCSEAFTLTQSLSYRRPWHTNGDDLDIKLRPSRDCISADLYCVFHQQLCEDWQSRESALDRTLRIYEIIPHRNALVHLSDPKTNCLVLLSFCFGLNNVIFVGLHNVPQKGSLPGPYLGLMYPGSRESFLEALQKFEALYKMKVAQGSSVQFCHGDRLDCNARLADISYLASEFDDLFNYILYDTECFNNFTGPLLHRMYSNRLYGRLMVALSMPSHMARYRKQTLVSFLKRFNDLLRIVCRILNDLHDPPGVRGSSEGRNFGTMAVVSLIYSYLYAILSIPISLTPWNKVAKGESCKCKSPGRRSDVNEGEPLTEVNKTVLDDSFTLRSSAHRLLSDDAVIPPQQYLGLLGADFASAAADAACVESTRRRDVMMSHAIGVLGDDGNWLRRCERYVDVIDNYKLSLCWYRRPLFSSCLLTNFKVVFPWVMLYHQTNIGPCGHTWLEWQGKTIESWSSLPLWKTSGPGEGSTIRGRGECVRCLKRLVSLRMRDCASFIFDLESEIKRSARRHPCL
ncbi:uncharacterized protein BXIN_2334 [Babesia sp. Xinjiang]|uniref:uncharacterized protein n=1 Tax=Babesia sp. Xinjiang TaxID=462227 RepID=UPI000A2633BC|nr:uncharacterized protein BXIN_2334 [Babesia sp. Xinjiang]ORM40791.1 hypothetical protein BXIN_2334 [Babesia sp. Xinjiang]